MSLKPTPGQPAADRCHRSVTNDPVRVAFEIAVRAACNILELHGHDKAADLVAKYVGGRFAGNLMVPAARKFALLGGVNAMVAEQAAEQAERDRLHAEDMAADKLGPTHYVPKREREDGGEA